MVDHYNTLIAIIHYYDTVMTVITIIAIIALLSLFSIGEVSIFWNTSLGNTQKMPVWATHLGYHVGEESQRSDRLVWSMTWTWSYWGLHTVSQPTSYICDVGPCLPANQTRPYSRHIWSPMIVATVSGRWVFLSPHLDACCEWRSISSCCNFLPVAQSMPIAPKLNKTQKINAQSCALQLMDQFHECARITDDFTFWKEKTKNSEGRPWNEWK